MSGAPPGRPAGRPVPGRPVCLVILDGFGLGEGGEGDAIAAARTPFFDRCDATAAKAQLETSGRAVGLPEGQMGNSEVGHMTLGAGRIIDHDLIRIQRAIDSGEIAEIPAMRALLAHAKANGGRLHLLGLVSDGGVHSSLEQLEGIVEIVAAEGVRPIVHAFTDGRDTAPRSALEFVEPLEKRLTEKGGAIATVAGRYFAMDRDKRWDRVARAYRAIVLREGERATSGVEAVRAAYARDEGDEFIAPTVIAQAPGIAPGDAVLFFNFRADRARELTWALTRERPDVLGDEIAALPEASPGLYTTMTIYDETQTLPALFPPVDIAQGLGQIVSRAGLAQLRIAETEKYAHVTYFFNGGVEETFEGEDRILIPSPRDVATYDEKPEMSADQVTDALIDAIARRDYGFVLVNYANPDMVGHTGKLPAGVEAVETVDRCLERLSRAVLSRGGALLVTADHGNIEQMIDPASGGPHTAHTTNPVPVWWLCEPRAEGATLDDGGLADVAPTICDLLGLTPPPEMTGTSLIAWSKDSSSS